MAVRCCPRPESYTDPGRLRAAGRKRSWDKGCGQNTCGFCGPRLADDWAGAIVAARPDLIVRMPVSPGMSWWALRKNVNNLLYERRKKRASAAAAWWVESPGKGERELLYVERGGPEDLDAFRRQAQSRSFSSAYFSPRPDELGDEELWTALLTSALLRLLRTKIQAVTYGLAAQVMGAHIELNTPPERRRTFIVHASRGFLEDGEGRALTRDAALRRFSQWRNRVRGEVEACAHQQVPGMDHDELDVLWHDEVWWKAWTSHALRRGRDVEEMGLNIFDPPEDFDPIALRVAQDRHWDLMHPTTVEEDEQGEDQLDELGWINLMDGL